MLTVERKFSGKTPKKLNVIDTFNAQVLEIGRGTKANHITVTLEHEITQTSFQVSFHEGAETRLKEHLESGEQIKIGIRDKLNTDTSLYDACFG